LQALIITHPVLQRFSGYRIGSSQIRRAVDTLAIKIGVHLIDVAPDLRFVGGSSSIEHAYNLPRPFAELHSVANIGVQEALMNAVADHHFALARRKPPALRELHPTAKLKTVLHHATHRNIDLARTVR